MLTIQVAKSYQFMEVAKIVLLFLTLQRYLLAVPTNA